MTISRDYTKEVGVSSPKKTLPRPVAYVLLALIAVGVSFGVAKVVAKTREYHATEKAHESGAAETTRPAATGPKAGAPAADVAAAPAGEPATPAAASTPATPEPAPAPTAAPQK